MLTLLSYCSTVHMGIESIFIERFRKMKKLITVLTIMVILVGAVFATTGDTSNGTAVIDIKVTISNEFPTFRLKATTITSGSQASGYNDYSDVASSNPTHGSLRICRSCPQITYSFYRSDLEYILCLVFNCLVNILYELVRNLLKLILKVLDLVFGDLGLGKLFVSFVTVAADVSYCHLALFAFLANVLYKVLTAFLGKFGEHESYYGTVV